MSEPTRFDEDPDPTGVRILLASQPDPGPMPADVSDRILAAFAEAGRRADLDADTGSQELSDELGLGVDAFDDFANLVAGQGVSGVDESGPAVPLHLVGRGTQPAGTSSETSGARTDVRTGSPSGSRSGAGMRGRVVDHRRRLTVLGGVAASVAALGLVGALLNNQGATSPTASSARAESVVGAAKDSSSLSAPADSATRANAPTAVNANGQPMHIELSTRTYTKATLARLAQDMLDAPGRQLGQPAVEAPSVGPIGTLIGLTDCVTTLGESDADAVFADLATFEGAPAVVIVVVDAGLKQAYAVSRSCSKGDPGLLFGPVDMP